MNKECELQLFWRQNASTLHLNKIFDKEFVIT